MAKPPANHGKLWALAEIKQLAQEKHAHAGYRPEAGPHGGRGASQGGRKQHLSQAHQPVAL